MAELTYRDAVARGIAQEMTRDPDVIFFGEDVAKAGGVFKTTVGLYEQFGPKRVRDCPISEQAILGAAMGAAMTGLKPIAEIMFSDFFAVCFDYIANEFPKSRYMSNGQLKCPLVVRTANGAGWRTDYPWAQRNLLIRMAELTKFSDAINSMWSSWRPRCGVRTPSSGRPGRCGSSSTTCAGRSATTEHRLAGYAVGTWGVAYMTRLRGADNTHAKDTLQWQPTYPSWRDGFAAELAAVGGTS